MSFAQQARAELDRQLAKEAKSQVRLEFSRSFEVIKSKMIKEFLSHPVTVEIKDGIDAKNSSGTLGGITNLFSFIGFNAGDDPTKSIENLLQSTNFRFEGTGIRTIKFKVELPTARDIFDATPMPWAAGRSWARGIESGISGLGYYLKVSKNSRSGLGIQSPKKVRKKGVKFKNTKYISDLIKRYEIEFSNIKI